jgi:copper chaperone CopZ
MTCEHCAGSVKRAVESVAGVASAEVDLGLGRLLVRGASLNARLVEEAVQLAGYSAKATGRAEGPACACSAPGDHGADGHDCGCGGHG